MPSCSRNISVPKRNSICHVLARARVVWSRRRNSPTNFAREAAAAAASSIACAINIPSPFPSHTVPNRISHSSRFPISSSSYVRLASRHLNLLNNIPLRLRLAYRVLTLIDTLSFFFSSSYLYVMRVYMCVGLMQVTRARHFVCKIINKIISFWKSLFLFLFICSL